jgi:hypothetical protein
VDLDLDPNSVRTLGWLVVSLVVGLMGAGLGGLVVLRRRTDRDAKAEIESRWPNKT